MSCGTHPVVSEKYPRYARSRPIYPFAKIYFVFLSTVVPK